MVRLRGGRVGHGQKLKTRFKLRWGVGVVGGGGTGVIGQVLHILFVNTLSKAITMKHRCKCTYLILNPHQNMLFPDYFSSKLVTIALILHQLISYVLKYLVLLGEEDISPK